LAVVLGVITVAYVIFVERQVWRKLFLIVAMILLLPIVSYSYKMLYVFLPLAMWINTPSQRDDIWYLTCYALLLIPKNYFWVLLLGKELSMNEFLNTGILCIIAISIMAQSTHNMLRKR